MTRKYRLERTAFIGCRNTAYMDVDDAEPCPFCGSRQVTIYPYRQGTTSYAEAAPPRLTVPNANRLSRARTNTTPVSPPSRLGIHAMRIRRHKLGQREETTEELSERVLARLRREYSLVSSEVWVDDVHRVDFVGFRPARNSPFPSSIERGEFVFVEVKSCMNDFKSGHGLTFRGDANWLVCPPDLAQTLYETRQLPKDAAVFCPDARGRLQKKFDIGIGSGSSRIASVSELLFRMVNHSAYSYRTSRGVFSNGYCPWCSPYRAKLLNDIDDVCGDMDLIEGIELALEVNDPQGVHLSMSHDNGIDCAYIPINYCPICGRNFRKDR